jgi:hypothetical protein
LRANDRAVETGFFGLAVRGAAVTVVSVAIVTDFDSFQDAVSAVGALAGTAVPAGGRFFLTIEATAVPGNIVSVVASLRLLYLIVAAGDAAHPWGGADEGVFNGGAVRAAAVSVVDVSVVAELICVQSPVAAQFAGGAGYRTDPTTALNFAGARAAVVVAGVAVVALFRPFDDSVAALVAALTLVFAAPLIALDLACIVAAVAAGSIAIVADLVCIYGTVATGGSGGGVTAQAISVSISISVTVTDNNIVVAISIVAVPRTTHRDGPIIFRRVKDRIAFTS